MDNVTGCQCQTCCVFKGMAVQAGKFCPPALLPTKELSGTVSALTILNMLVEEEKNYEAALQSFYEQLNILVYYLV